MALTMLGGTRASMSELKNITREAVELAVAEFDALTRERFLESYRFGPAKEYFLVFKGQRYDSKAIVGVAYKHVAEDGKPLGVNQLSGGERTVGRVLKDLGFTVEKLKSTPPQPSFERGRTYNRRADIHVPHGGQQQGGIATPDGPFILLFTGQQGTTYGYQDGRLSDGTFEYTGEGQAGDMEFIRGNKAIRDHALNGKDLLLFETLKKKGECRFLGSFVCDGWDIRSSKDRNGANRKVIVFKLVPMENIEASISEEMIISTPATSLADLRKFAYGSANASNSSSGKTARNVYVRSRDVRDYVLARANGICEACDAPAPFKRTNGTPYLEPHHTRRVSDGGPDHPRWVGAICPTCHRHIHHGADGNRLNEALQAKLVLAESEEIA